MSDAQALVGSERGYLDPTWASIARELATNIYSVDVILSNHGVSQVEWAKIQNSPVFASYYTQAVIEFNSAGNGIQRVELKSLGVLENSMLVLNRIIHDPSSNNKDRLEAMRLAAQLGKVLTRDTEKVAGGTGGGFHLTIDFGGGSPMTIEGKAEPAPAIA